MKIARAQEMRDAEGRAFAAGLPARVLMETAGGAVARAASAHLPPGGSCLVVVGPGQNGGDGLCAARHLLAQGMQATVWLLADPSRLRGDALDQYRILKGAAAVRWVDQEETPQGMFDAAIDAIFGISLRGELSGAALRAVHFLAARDLPVVAVDLPSGVRADTGEVAGSAVRADCTVALGALKPGHVFLPGRGYVGKVVVESMGLLPAWTRDLPLSLIGRMPPGGGQGAQEPKQSYGRALVIAGSAQYPGAAWLAARGAARGGAGMTILASVEAVLSHPAALPEVILRHLHGRDGRIDPAALLREQFEDAQAVAIGPGLGAMEDAPAWRRAILAIARPLVLDADGLRAFAGCPEKLSGRTAPTVITPHLGEARHLLGHAVGDAPHERLAAAEELARRTGAVALLKGQPTFVATPDGRVGLIDAGGPELASAGTGDVLTGLIAAQLAQGVPARPAAERAALAHARAGERLRSTAARGHLASEIADCAALTLGEES
ncbi:MAG: NAD(P)H-hydrate dehydratase [Thermaerobacter sp.]|nr:NAD(P)H-hydrate dehydratase [Thermaerobacter sp.]